MLMVRGIHPIEVCEDHSLNLGELVLKRGGQHVETLQELREPVEVPNYTGVDHIKLVVQLKPEREVTVSKLSKALEQLHASG